MTAYAYLRKSVVKIDDPHNSAEGQEAAVRAMAARHGDAESLVLLSDWDKSGRLGRSRRPGYDALWRAIESGQATAVYSYSMSRLARSVSELTRLFETCSERSIPVRLEADVVDTSTASGRMTATILASVAVFEADVAGERMKTALQAKVARGERVGAPQYGALDGEEPDAVLAAFEEAGSFNGAARLLQERGVPCRWSRRGWGTTSVARVVRRADPSLVGKTEQGVRAGKADFVLARLLHCPTCDTILAGRRDRNGRRVRYSCHYYSVAHSRTGITESLILPAIMAEVAHLRTPYDAVELTTGDEAERAGLEGKAERIKDMFADGTIGKPERDGRLAAVGEALERLQLRREIIEAPHLDWTAAPGVVNAALRALFSRIELDPVTFAPVCFGWTIPEWRAPSE